MITASPHKRPSARHQAKTPSLFYRLGYAMASHPWPVIAIWIVFFVGSGLLLPRFLDTLTGFPVAVNGSESQLMEQMIQQKFSRSYTEQDLIVFNSPTQTVYDVQYQRVIASAVRNVSSVPGVANVISPLDPQADNQVSSDGHAAAALISLRGDALTLQKLAPKITQAAQRAATAGIHVNVTGEAEIMSDMAVQETQDLALAERIGLPIALLVLLVAFGSLVAAGLPLLLAGIGITVTFGLLSLATFVTTFDLFVETVVTMIGLGVGIDYSMFIITRFREELARGSDTHEAIAMTIATSGKVIFFSGLTVLLSLASLLLVNMKLFADMSIGAMMTVGIMVTVALTLLPAVLGLAGRHINRLAIPFLRRTVEQPDPDHGFWARWAHGIMRYPVFWTSVTVLVLLVLIIPVTQLNLGLDLGINTLADRSSGQGVAVLQRYFSPGVLSPIQIVVEDPRGPLNDQDLNVVARLTSQLETNKNVIRVESITTMLDRAVRNHSAATLSALAVQPQMAKALGYVVNLGQGNNVTVIDAVPRVASDSNAATQLVRQLRSTTIPRSKGQVPLTILVGGMTAQIVDMTDESAQKIPLVIGVVLALAFLLLMLVFRSLFLPLKAIILNLLSVGAAYGMLVFVFQQGTGQYIFHFTPVGNVQVYLPLLTFALLFGLSMDYEVFMIGRMKEEWERTGHNEIAVARGLQHTARAITSAAAIMVAVFLSFAFTSMLEIQETGFALAAAIFVDATIIRVLLVPAAMRLMGRWNWWFPHFLDRIVPHVDLSEGANNAADKPLAQQEIRVVRK